TLANSKEESVFFEEPEGRDDLPEDADETSSLPACFQVKNDLLGIERFLALREHHYPFSKLHPFIKNCSSVIVADKLTFHMEFIMKAWCSLFLFSFVIVVCSCNLFAGEDKPFVKVVVDQKPVSVVAFDDICYSSFFVTGKHEITLAAADAIESFQISPLSYGIKGIARGSKLSFKIDKPCKLIVQLNGKRFFLFADRADETTPNPGRPNVVSLASYIKDSKPGSLVTKSVQHAMDETAAAHQILYVPAGTYATGALFPPSGLNIYLEKGATFEATQASQNETTHRLSDGREVKAIGYWTLYEVHDVVIGGFGTIDGNGLALESCTSKRTIPAMLVVMEGCRNIIVKDVILKNPRRWNTHILYSDRVVLDGIKIINSINLPNTDAIDPDNSRDVTIKNVFSYASDDSIAIKTTATYFNRGLEKKRLPRTSERITITGGVFWTKKSSLKVGTETHRDIIDVLFENNDVIHADRAMAIYVRDGGTIKNVRFLNNRSEFVGDDALRRLLLFTVEKRKQKGKPAPTSHCGRIENILVRDFTAQQQGENNSTIRGCSKTEIATGFKFENFVVGGKRCKTFEEAQIDIQPFATDTSIE
ncbi:MAG: glycosyl hydrolase family 28 protein, partial [Planctomycetia bacterium]|nr:glycosyl hydrolase family 28 protein [Planctomycetia bacterium]